MRKFVVFKRRNKYSAVPQAIRGTWAKAKIESYGNLSRENGLEEARRGADFAALVLQIIGFSPIRRKPPTEARRREEPVCGYHSFSDPANLWNE